VITIIHGGQTGVDRGAHEGAICNGWFLDGYMPSDGRDEFGRIPPEVAKHLRAHESRSYAARTEMNVRSSDAALIVVRDADDPRATPGTTKTLDLVIDRRMRRMIVDPETAATLIARWIWNALLRVPPLLQLDGGALEPTPTRLLVAGPRQSKWLEARVETAALLRRVHQVLTEIPQAQTVSKEAHR
jgi:putative molybdenum carrier protein